MVKLLRQLISCLSEAVGAWEKFQRKDIEYFLYDGNSLKAASYLKPSLNAVDKVFWDLKGLLRKLRELERELCQDNPQGVSLLSYYEIEAELYSSTKEMRRLIQPA